MSRFDQDRIPDSGRYRPARSIVMVAAGLLLASSLLQKQQHADAHPVFAQALSVDCKVCHTQVPALNSYGRYVARTWYAVLNPATLKKTFPVYVGLKGTYDSQTQTAVETGNDAIHAAGLIGNDFSYHVHQWLVQNGDAGGTDTGWVAYNNIFNRNGHIAIGKSQPVGPSFFNNWSDVSGFFAPTLTIGEHSQLLGTGGRWGASFTYGNDKYFAQAGFYGSPDQLNLATDFNETTDKAVQWHVAYQRPDKPVTTGIFGNLGTFPLAEGGVDRYSAQGAYVQADPTAHLPGGILYYQIGNDGNPTATGIAAHSRAYTAAVYFPILGRRETMLGFRREMTDDGLGTISQYGLVNLGFRPFNYPYLHMDVEAGLTNGSKPAWRYYIWLTPPLVGVVNQRAPISAVASGGEAIYAAKCTACHGANGQGTPGAFPALAGNQHVIGSDLSGLIEITAHGRGAMPAFKPALSNAERAALLTYIRGSWGNHAGPVTEADVAAVK